MSELRLFKVILIVLALTLVVFGGWRFINPIGFYTFSGLDLAGDAGLLSEVRGAGGIIMVSGFVVGLGAVQHAWSRTSVLLAALVFLSLGLGRLTGIALDGLPGAEVTRGWRSSWCSEFWRSSPSSGTGKPRVPSGRAQSV